MPRDFKSFSKDYSKEAEKVLNDNKNKVDEYENILNKYKNMPQTDLMSNLFSEAAKLKNEGKLNSEALNNLKSTLSPFLNAEQKEMLNSIVRAINDKE